MLSANKGDHIIVLPPEEKKIVDLCIDLHCSILEENGCADLYTEIVKKTLLENFHRNPKPWLNRLRKAKSKQYAYPTIPSLPTQTAEQEP